MIAKRGVIFFFLLFSYTCAQSQYSWDWRDPNDLNIIDLGDNKVILYNAIGLGLSYFINKMQKSGEWQNSLSFEFITEYQREPLSTLYSIKFRRIQKLQKWLDAGIELGAFITENEGSVLGFGGCPIFTWHIVNKPSFKLSYDNGVGPLVFSSPFPTGGTKFNFYTFYGIQVQYKINRRFYSLGFRNTHISNAEIAGRDRNPAYDGYGLVFKTQLGPTKM